MHRDGLDPDGVAGRVSPGRPQAGHLGGEGRVEPHLSVEVLDFEVVAGRTGMPRAGLRLDGVDDVAVGQLRHDELAVVGTIDRPLTFIAIGEAVERQP